MKRDNPFIGMTPEELNEYLDDLVNMQLIFKGAF